GRPHRLPHPRPPARPVLSPPAFLVLVVLDALPGHQAPPVRRKGRDGGGGGTDEGRPVGAASSRRISGGAWAPGRLLDLDEDALAGALLGGLDDRVLLAGG